MTQPLHPRGSLRARFGADRTEDVFRKLGVGARSCDLGDEGLYLAEELVAANRWLNAPADQQALAILVLALVVAQRQGSTRLRLDAKGHLRTLVHDIVRMANLSVDAHRVVRKILELATPGFDGVIGAGDARMPLVVDDGCIYTERSRWLEQRVARRLGERLGTTRGREVDAVIAELAARPAGRALSDEQLAAVSLALRGPLSIVTGGPGTGKTLVASAIVRGFARLGLANVALAAQTGKAANRLTQVIGEQLAAVGEPPPPSAQTLHRLLGYRNGRFAHHALSPLPVDAVIVDEASMIDLELVDALLDALPASAPLVLIGDAHQLPAIDAGQLLADLANRDPANVAAPRVAVLAKSYRMDTSDADGRAVFEAARAIHDGNASRLVERGGLATPKTPGTLAFRGVEWVETQAEHEATLRVASGLWHHFGGANALRLADRVFRFRDGRIDPAQHAELEQLWHQLGRARILTVTRALPTGSVAINQHLHELALDRMSVTGRPELVPGEPVMITANDYQRGLFNGDQGIVVRADEALGRHHYRAIFRCAGELRPFAIEALRDRLELSWALTVHKSQGSEMDAVALLLPHEDLPLVTRELLYTGITRARTAAVVCGTKSVLLAGAKRNALRDSGLAARLAAQ